MLAQELIKECVGLQSAWTQRNMQFREWMELITMEDKLKEEKMESFVSNEPRTFYNLALHLLVPAIIAPRIPLEEVKPIDVESASQVENFLSMVFLKLERSSFLRGRGGFLRELVSFIIATGWYSVFSMPTDSDVIAEVWNPAEVFPEYDDSGLLRCAHVYSMPARAVRRKAQRKGWKLQQLPSGSTSVKVYDYWTFENEIENGIVVGTELVKPLTAEAGLQRSPIYVAPIAGLPDRGAILPGTDWTKHIGQSLLATDANIYGSTNKLFTFLMQLLRDTAQARWVEKSSGTGKVKPEDIFKRGAVFHLGLGESLDTLSTPPIPIELRTLMFDISAMRQKGSLPDVMYGSLQQQITSYLMQQISAAASHVLRPYHQALKFLLEELCNDWLDDMRTYNITPYGTILPSEELPRVEVDIRLDIPGDIVQRATVARMLDPGFRLSHQAVSDMLFPEIKNPLAEQARVLKDLAMQHPVAAQLALILALRQQADLLRQAGDTKGADLYQAAASALQPKPETQQGAVREQQRLPQPSSQPRHLSPLPGETSPVIGEEYA